MPRALRLSVRFHDGRYHGRPEWPPSPARLFQALLAGAAKGNALSADDRDALSWLERLDRPIIAAPATRTGRAFTNYVPNNHDFLVNNAALERIGIVNADKFIKPFLFDARIPLVYAWRFDRGDEHARRVCEMAKRLYQLGRGVD